MQQLEGGVWGSWAACRDRERSKSGKPSQKYVVRGTKEVRIERRLGRFCWGAGKVWQWIHRCLYYNNLLNFVLYILCNFLCMCYVLQYRCFFKLMFHITDKLTVKLGKQKHKQACTTLRNVMTSQTAWLPLPPLPQPSHVMACDFNSLGLFLLCNMGMITIPASWGGYEN